MKRPLAWLVLLLALLSISASVYGSGSGVIVEGNPMGTESVGPLNPLLCANRYCRRITDFLFPALYALDPATGLPVPAAPDNDGLALDVTAPDSATQQVRLRNDLLWSDGTPVTAYDVFYSYLAAASLIDSPYYALRDRISAARVIDAYTVEFAYTEANCATPARATFPVIPAHVFDPGFRQAVAEFGTEGSLQNGYERWLEFYPYTRFSLLYSHPFNTAPTVTAGVFRYAETVPGQEIRLVDQDGDLAFIYRNVPPGMNEVQFFLGGGSNLLVNPAYEHRDDLRALPDVQVSLTPAATWDYIAFNLANPSLPRGAFNGDGLPLEQGQHPLFGDVRVRQALQMAINVDELVETALLGYGIPLASSRIPGTWGANDSLQPPPYDPRGAESLLEQAGWRDTDQDGIRDCVNCLYARPDSSLYFRLTVAGGGRREIAAQLIARQLWQVGVGVDWYTTESGEVTYYARNQQFDAYMAGFTQEFPAELDQTARFTRAGDMLYEGDNAGSYFNPQVETLMTQALTLPGCDAGARAGLYRNIQSLLQQDQPYVWLYAPQDMLVTRGIAGVAPYPGQPFWNIRDWKVMS